MYLQREVPPPFNIQFCLIHPHGLILRIFEKVLFKLISYTLFILNVILLRVMQTNKMKHFYKINTV